MTRVARSPALWIAATRPAFLTISALAVVVGLAAGHVDGVALSMPAAALSLIGALLAHAGSNVVNDFHDRETDALNVERVSPFTGGSRMIQDQRLSALAMAYYGYGLLAATALIGLVLALDGRPLLWPLGMIGLFCAWAYSAPPLRLSARGIGEFIIALSWLLVVVGSDVVQRGAWSFTPIAAGLPTAVLIAAILLANEFPDRASDAASGKNTVVVGLGLHGAAWFYAALIVIAYGWLAGVVVLGALPPLALVALAAAPVSGVAAAGLLRFRPGMPTAQLRPALAATIVAAHVHAALLIGALFWH